MQSRFVNLGFQTTVACTGMTPFHFGQYNAHLKNYCCLQHLLNLCIQRVKSFKVGLAIIKYEHRVEDMAPPRFLEQAQSNIKSVVEGALYTTVKMEGALKVLTFILKCNKSSEIRV